MIRHGFRDAAIDCLSIRPKMHLRCCNLLWFNKIRFVSCRSFAIACCFLQCCFSFRSISNWFHFTLRIPVIIFHKFCSSFFSVDLFSICVFFFFVRWFVGSFIRSLCCWSFFSSSFFALSSPYALKITQQIKIKSSADCPRSLQDGTFLKTYGANVGFTGTWASFADILHYSYADTDTTNASPSSSMQPSEMAATAMEPTGLGYVANKNRIVGAVSQSHVKQPTNQSPKRVLYFRGRSQSLLSGRLFAYRRLDL